MIYVSHDEIAEERADSPWIPWALAERRAEARKAVRMVKNLSGCTEKDEDMRTILLWLIDKVSGSE